MVLEALLALLTGAATDEWGLPPARPAVPFEKHAEIDCDWMMKDRGEPLIRGSISRGEQSPVLYILDPLFAGWSDNEDHEIELVESGSGKRARALAYVLHSKETSASLSIFLDAEARSVVGGAKYLTIWKDGRPVLNLAFANTPSAEELAACESEGD